ncbi:phage major capsid protein [Leucobacter sp. HY1908]
MASYTYPVPHDEGTLTTDELHRILSNPRLVAAKVAELSKLGFIADYLLSSKLNAAGGGVYYETGASVEDLFAGADPEALDPLTGYPLVLMDSGAASSVRTTKWGLGTRFSDEKLSREGRSYFDRGMKRISASVIRHVDTVAMAVVASKVTDNFSATAAWSSAGAVAETLLAASQERADLATGLELDTVVLPPAKWAKLIGMLIDDKALPREAGNIVMTGREPVDALGFTWATSPNYKGSNLLLVDRDHLGGMADEDIQSPDWAKGAAGIVESKSERIQGIDGYEAAARRVTVPVVLDPLAGLNITGTGL